MRTDPFPSLHELPMIVGTEFGVSSDPLAGQVRAHAHNEGFQQGYADGRSAAIADVGADVSFALTALHGAIEDLSRREVMGLEAFGAEAMALGLAIAEEILGRELELVTNPALDALHRALVIAPDRGAVVARFHPDDLELIEPNALATLGREVELVADRSVERGGCLLDVGAMRVDAQLGPALQRVREALDVASHTAEVMS